MCKIVLCVRGGGILGLRPKGPLQGGVVLCRTENPLLTFQEATHVGRDEARQGGIVALRGTLRVARRVGRH